MADGDADLPQELPATSTRCPMCQHQPQCPPAKSPARQLARTVAAHPEQGWSLLCNGVVVFDDLGELLPLESAPVARAA